MSDLDLDTLEATARAVCVPEEWTIWHDLDHQGFKTVGDAESYVEMKETGEVEECDPIAHVYTDDLAEHIAAFDPPTVLALIARLREAEAQRDNAEKQVEIRSQDSIAARIARSNVRAVEEWAATQALLKKQTRYIEELEQVDSVGLKAKLREAEAVLGAIRLMLPTPMSEPLSRDFTGRPFPRTIDGDRVAAVLSRYKPTNQENGEEA